jgi:hypothetical protein
MLVFRHEAVGAGQFRGAALQFQELLNRRIFARLRAAVVCGIP